MGKSSDATAYALNDNWSRLRIVNLTALKHRQTVENPFIDFKAFITSFKDNFIPGWQETQYPNQSVPIAHQSMPKRLIQVSWTVPSTNAKEAIENLQRCAWLAQSMYPILKRKDNRNYGQKSTFMAIKFANLIQANDTGPLPGYITSFSYTPNFGEGVHIMNQSGAPPAMRKYFHHANGKHLFPNLVDISLEFKPIQTRDSFGFVEGGNNGWSNSSWPYGIKIDSQLTPSTQAVTNATPSNRSNVAQQIAETEGEEMLT